MGHLRHRQGNAEILMNLRTKSIRELIVELAATETSARTDGFQPDRLAYQRALVLELRRRRRLCRPDR